MPERNTSAQARATIVAIEQIASSGKTTTPDIAAVADVGDKTARRALAGLEERDMVQRTSDDGQNYYITDHARSIGAALMRPNKLDALESVALKAEQEGDVETDGGVPTPPWKGDNDD